MRKLIVAALFCAGLPGCTGYSDNSVLPTIRSVWARPTAPSPAPLPPDFWSPKVYYITDREFDKRDVNDIPAIPPELGRHNANWKAATCGHLMVDLVAADDPLYATIETPPPPTACEPAEPEGPAGADTSKRLAESAFATFVKDIAAATPNHCVFLYIQGYNNDFDTAIMRTAQVFHDTGVFLDKHDRCLPLAFSWASAGQWDRYVSDVEHSSYSLPLLRALLLGLKAQNLRVDIVAHSMGTRLTLQTLATLQHACEQKPPIDELVLAAPDIGAEKNNNDFMTLKDSAAACFRRMTIYGSRNDSVLAASESIHGGIARAGRDPETAFAYQSCPIGHAPFPPGTIDAVDASEAPGDPFGHGYYAVSYEMISDIARALTDVPAGVRAAQPSPTLVNEPGGDASCGAGQPPLPRYRLAVSEDRRQHPGFLERLIRDAIPLKPGD
jgi:esterase/lipase superfamily enzyme